MAHFIPTKDEATAQETGKLFFTHIFKHHGLPKDIMSDRNPKFTSKFWRTLWKKMSSEFKMSISITTPLWDKCEDETHTPKSGKLESSGIPKNSELEFKGQNTSH